MQKENASLSLTLEIMERITRWDLSFLVDAKFEATRSKDPSTQVGAVIVRPDLTTASKGYNGLPRGVNDSKDRLTDRNLKYPMTVHAELNAITTSKEALDGYTIYTSLPPCASCAGAIIQSGIRRVVTIKPSQDKIDRWGTSFTLMELMFQEARVELNFYDEADVLVSAMTRGVIFIEGDQPFACACQNHAQVLA
jgi:dCMP deaminase